MRILVLLLAIVFSSSAVADPDGPPRIQTAADLQKYLADHGRSDHGSASDPLSYLPLQARRLFLQSLRWGRHGLGGFSYGPLVEELTAKQAHHVLALFGAQGAMPPASRFRAERDEQIGASSPTQALPDDWALGTGLKPGERISLANYRVYLEGIETGRVEGAQLRALVASEYHTVTRALNVEGGCKPQLSKELAHAAWRIALWARFYDAKPAYLSTLRDCYDSFSQGELTPAEIDQMYTVLVQHHDLDEANKLRASSPEVDLKSIPPIRKAPVRADQLYALEYSTQPSPAFSPQKVELKRRQLVVVASPSCHFSRNAATYFSADSQLPRLLREAIWLALPGDLLNFESVERWNAQFAPARLRIADHEIDALPMWSTPTFYLMEDGKVVRRIVGWDDAGTTRDTLLAWSSQPQPLQ